MDSALVLTTAYQPHDIFMWHQSVTAVLTNKAFVLAEYDSEIRSPSVTLRTPAVILLRKHIAVDKSAVKFSRHGVYQHYGYRCMYCGQRFAARDLTYDHVIPRKRGGPTNWGNILPACKPDNARKGSRTPQEAGMKPIRWPSMPKTLPMTGPFLLPTKVPELWKPFLEGQRTIQLVG